MQFDKIFLGNTPSNQRKFITELLKYLVKDRPLLYIPAVGQFTLVKCAIDAGYKTENIYTSEISLFSCLMGYYYSGKPIDSLNFTIAEPYAKEYKTKKTETEKLAYLYWLMKISQLDNSMMYQKVVYDEYVDNKEFYITNLEKQLDALHSFYKGIHFEIEDLRVMIRRQYEEPDKTVVILNPPAFAKGYEKMFNFKGNLEFSVPIEEFVWKKEYHNLYEESKAKPEVFIWYRYQNTQGFDPKDVIYGNQYTDERTDYWLFTKPELLKDFQYTYRLDLRNLKDVRKWKAPLFTDNDEIKPNSKIAFSKVSEEVALYYRDMLAHKLGATKAEQYYLMLIDGKVFSVLGVMARHLFTLKDDKVFENFGFTVPLKKYPRANRLLMLAITCRDFKDVVKNSISRFNRFYDLNGLKTTCLSKYRKVKLNNGILEIEKKEKMKNDFYKIVYATNWHDRSFADCIKLYLEEEKNVL